jgi:signal transduction histidine kinase
MDLPKMKSVMKTIQDGAQSSLDLVNSILDEAALGTGKVIMKKRAFDLKPLVDKTLQTFQPLMETQSVTVELKSGETLYVFGDEQRIGQVMSNLLGNAFKYAKQDSVVKIALHEDQGRVYCEVTNQKGEGSPQLNQSLYKSVGYGLDIVNEVLKQHNSELIINDGELYSVCFDLPTK